MKNDEIFMNLTENVYILSSCYSQISFPLLREVAECHGQIAYYLIFKNLLFERVNN